MLKEKVENIQLQTSTFLYLSPHKMLQQWLKLFWLR